MTSLKEKLFRFITHEEFPDEIPPSDIETIKTISKPGDVLLIL